MSLKLLIISNDNDLFKNLQRLLSPEGYETQSVLTGADGLRELLSRDTDILLVDLQTPDVGRVDWLEILRQMEFGKDLPTIVLSRTRNEDEIAGAYRWGADEFISYPCASDEFCARMRAVVRRRFDREEQLGQSLSGGPIELDLLQHRCFVRGKAVELRPREFELLEILLRKSGRVLSRGHLLETIWGMSPHANTRSVDVAVSRLRAALGLRAGRWVETVERRGYRFRNPAQLIR